MITFHTNCTLPQEVVGFVTSPNTRGTSDLLWSCLATLLLCTWTVQHLNVPRQSTPQTTRQAWRRRVTRLLTKLRWMLVTLVIPEYILGKAYSDRCSARIHTKDSEDLAQEDGVEWSVAHTFLANIGGFAIKFEEAQTTPSHSRRTGEQQSTVTAHSQDVSGQYVSSSIGHESNRLSGAYGPEAVGGGHTIAANSTRALSDDPINFPTAPPSVSEVDVQTGASGSAAEGSQYAVRSGVMRDGSMVPAMQPPCVAPPTILEKTSEEDMNIIRSDSRASHAISERDAVCERDTPGDPAQGKAAQRMIETQCTRRSPAVPPSSDEVNKSPMRDQLESLASHPRWSAASWVAREIADAALLGPSPWAPDGNHIRLVDTVLQGPYLDWFDTAWEKSECVRGYAPWYFNLIALQGNVWILDACQLLYARKSGIIDRLPDITRDQVDDRNKGDLVVKGIIVVQVIWFIIQLVTRAATGLPSSQLEVVVVALASCAFATYVLLLDKPQDIRTVVFVTAAKTPKATDFARVAIRGSYHSFRMRRRHWIPNASASCNGTRGGLGMNIRYIAASFLAATMFGSIHCIAWNFQFPTATEQVLWKVTALTTTVLPSLIVVLIFVAALTIHQTKRTMFWSSLIFHTSCGVYAIARIYLTVEVFRDLAFEDPRTFRTTWSANWPHFG